MSKSDKTEIDKQIATSIKNFSMRAKGDRDQRHVIEMPEFIQQKAELISAHFLLPSGSRIADMGCGTGEVSYVLAQLNPRIGIIGVDHDADAIAFARKNYKLPNLSFFHGDITLQGMEDETLDGIVNSNILHGVYSANGYNPDIVGDLLQKQVQKLKPGGTMLIRDYMMPPEREFILLELPNSASTGKDIQSLSDADLLVLFSQTARPLPTGGSEGFFIEELQPRRINTRLFRLPHKWAVEFIHRKDLRERWEREINDEFTFYTWQDYCRECTRVGMRMVFSSPYWNPWVVKNHFKGSFQFYTEDYKPLSYPATNYFIVAQKLADKQSLLLEERRPSYKPIGDLRVMVVRDKKSGTLHELVKRPGEHCDVVPYRITPDNRLMLYVHSGYPRPIVNAGSRGRHNLDGKKWSGHLIEPISMETLQMTDDVESNRRMIFDYVHERLGLRTKSEESWYVGQPYFPAPDQIDEAIEPVFVEVENPYKSSWPVQPDPNSPFAELGSIAEIEATSIIYASQVGLLPEPRLELHVVDLMHRYNIPYPKWIGEVMPKVTRHAVKVHKPEDILKDAERADFTEIKKGTAVHLKPVKAVFIEEGKVGQQTRGLSAQDIEYIVTDDGIENIAIVLPITRDWDNNLLVALDPKVMPVPNRMGGDGAMLNAPTFPLPRDVQTIEDAKAFIASKFKVSPEQVSQIGSSYFTHVGIMPQRVYPFTVASANKADTNRGLTYMLLDALITLVWSQRHYKINTSILKAIARTHIRMGGERHDMQMIATDDLKKHRTFELSTEKVAVEATNAGYSSIPSRVLGQRGGAATPALPEPVAAVIQASQKPAAVSEKVRSNVKAFFSSTAAGAAGQQEGKRLSDNYTRAKMKVNKTMAVEMIEKDVDAIRKSLAKTRSDFQSSAIMTDKGKA